MYVIPHSSLCDSQWFPFVIRFTIMRLITTHWKKWIWYLWYYRIYREGTRQCPLNSGNRMYLCIVRRISHLRSNGSNASRPLIRYRKIRGLSVKSPLSLSRSPGQIKHHYHSSSTLLRKKWRRTFCCLRGRVLSLLRTFCLPRYARIWP